VNTAEEGEEIELEPHAELVAQMLADGFSDAEATLAIGRQAKWAQRQRKSNPLFVQRIEDIKAQRVAQAAAGLGALLERAVKAVDRNLDSGRPMDQLQAARLVFDRFRVFRGDASSETLAELREDIAALREQLQQLRPSESSEVRS